jgi:putative transcriptional regulator
MSKLGKRLIKSADEALAIARGEADPATYRVHVPAEIDVRKIRQRLQLSQDDFAAKFGIPRGTLLDWEQHRRRPEGAARAYLIVIDKETEAVMRALMPQRSIDHPPVRAVLDRFPGSVQMRSGTRQPPRRRAST